MGIGHYIACAHVVASSFAADDEIIVRCRGQDAALDWLGFICAFDGGDKPVVATAKGERSDDKT